MSLDLRVSNMTTADTTNMMSQKAQVKQIPAMGKQIGNGPQETTQKQQKAITFQEDGYEYEKPPLATVDAYPHPYKLLSGENQRRADINFYARQYVDQCQPVMPVGVLKEHII